MFQKNDATASIGQVLDKDGVHLTPSASKVFLDDIILYWEEFFSVEFIDLEN
jgi:hypothetical protein